MTPNFSLDDLMTFYEVVRSGNLTKASENLRIATSTVSRKVTHLEQAIGGLLLQRDTRRIVPTQLGLQLFERCKRIASEVDNLSGDVLSSHLDVQGTLRVGIPSDFGTGWLGDAVCRFADQYPSLQIDLEVATGPTNLIDGRFDVTIQYGPLRDSRLVCKRLATLSRGLYTSPMYLKQVGGKIVSLKQLARASWIVTKLQLGENLPVLDQLQDRRDGTNAFRFTINSMRLARELVLCGGGVAILPHAMCASHVARGDLVHILPKIKIPASQVTAIVLARSGLPRTTRAFLDFLTEHLAQAEPSS